MEAQSTQPKSQSSRKDLCIDRITVERLDASSDMARIETVPMRRDHLPDFRHLGPQGQSEILNVSDDLDLWDLKRRKIHRLRIRSLRNKLKLRKKEVLTENMVFWRTYEPSTRADRVFHATDSARTLTKTIYRSALGPGRRQP